MLNRSDLEQILTALPRRTLGVLGDLFLDRYLDLDPGLTEPSLETGLDAYQVTRVRCCPGAAGTVINNLASLGVGRIVPISLIGDDGEGFELRRALARLGVVDMSRIRSSGQRFTPTYTKPMLLAPNGGARELNRIDIKNRAALPREEERLLVADLEHAWPDLDALCVVDQVSEAECGVVTTAVRHRLEELSRRHPGKVILADSRERVGLFRGAWLKPNERECAIATGTVDADEAVRALARRAGRPVFCTRGEAGIALVDPRDAAALEIIPARRVMGPIDPVGAGDSAAAAIASALAAGAPPRVAAAFANVVASITIQQLGTTGTATPEQLRKAIDA